MNGHYTKKPIGETTYASHDNSMDTVQLIEFFEEKTAVIFYYVPKKWVISWIVALLHGIEGPHLCPSSTTRTCMLPELAEINERR